jgi:hypothetical protein
MISSHSRTPPERRSKTILRCRQIAASIASKAALFLARCCRHSAGIRPRRATACGQMDTFGGVDGRRCLTIVATSVLVFAAAGVALALGEEREYTARAYVIQVPAALGPQRGVELARSEAVLHQTIELAGIEAIHSAELRRRSTAESTSRMDIAVTVEADRPQQAIQLATAYAKAVRRSIPDDEGLPTRGVGARSAEGGLGPLRWPLIASLVGLLIGVALAIVNAGLRQRSAHGPRPDSSPHIRGRYE